MSSAIVGSLTFEQPVDAREALAASAGRVRFLDVPEQRFLAIDGTGRPGDDAFREAMSALYPVAYTLHFALKRRGVGAPVGILEGLYRTGTVETLLGRTATEPLDTADFRWTLMLPVPADATQSDIDAAIEEVRRKKAPPSLDQLRVETIAEGPCAQILHVGAYNAEGETLERLHDAIRAAGLRPQGSHHEIYVSDPNRTAPEHLKTVIRQPVTSSV